MNEQSDSISRKDEIRCAGEIFAVESKTQTESVRRRTDLHFRAGVSRTHAPHDGAAYVFAYSINHSRE